MSIGAVQDTNRQHRVATADSVQPTKTASLPTAASDAATESGKAPVPAGLQQGMRELMQGVGTDLQRRLENGGGWDEVNVRRPCPRGGNCSGVKRGVPNQQQPRRTT